MIIVKAPLGALCNNHKFWNKWYFWESACYEERLVTAAESNTCTVSTFSNQGPRHRYISAILYCCSLSHAFNSNLRVAHDSGNTMRQMSSLSNTLLLPDMCVAEAHYAESNRRGDLFRCSPIPRFALISRLLVLCFLTHNWRHCWCGQNVSWETRGKYLAYSRPYHPPICAC